MPIPRARATRGVAIRRVTPSRRIYAGIGPHQAVRHMHQGGLAGAVLSQQGMHFPWCQHEIDPAQRMHGAESLVDSGKLEHRGHDQRPVG